MRRGRALTCMYVSLSPNNFAFNLFESKTVENLKCIKTVLESGRFDRPIFVILAVVGFGTRERPSSVVQFSKVLEGSDGFRSFQLFSGRLSPGA